MSDLLPCVVDVDQEMNTFSVVLTCVNWYRALLLWEYLEAEELLRVLRGGDLGRGAELCSSIVSSGCVPCVKCRRGGKWPSAVVLYLGTSLHLPRKQKYNFIIPFYC